MSIIKGGTYTSSCKQKLNTKKTKEAELVAIDNAMLNRLTFGDVHLHHIIQPNVIGYLCHSHMHSLQTFHCIHCMIALSHQMV